MEISLDNCVWILSLQGINDQPCKFTWQLTTLSLLEMQKLNEGKFLIVNVFYSNRIYET